MTTIIGLDPSLRHTGVARWRDGRLSTLTIHTTDEWRVEERFRWINGNVWPLLDDDTFVVLESPYVMKNGDTSMKLAGLHYLLRYGLYVRKVPFGVVTPAELKKFATGHGGGRNADKAAMVALATATFGHQLRMGAWIPPVGTVDGDSHEADALWAMALGLHHAGVTAGANGAMEPGLDHMQAEMYGKITADWPSVAFNWEAPE